MSSMTGSNVIKRYSIEEINFLSALCQDVVDETIRSRGSLLTTYMARYDSKLYVVHSKAK